MNFRNTINEIKYFIIRIISIFNKIPHYPYKIISYRADQVKNNISLSKLAPYNYGIFEIKNACIWGNNGTILINNHYYISELNRKLPSSKRNPIFYQHKITPPKLLEGNTAVIASIAGDVYYHWMIDILPRLILLKNSPLFDKIDYFVFNKVSQPFQTYTLNQIGIPQQKIIQTKNLFHYHYKTENLIFPSFTSAFNSSSTLTIESLKNTFCPKNKLQDDSNKLIFISRRNINGRTLLQEKQIYEYLNQKGFTRFYAEDYSLPEQIKIFYNSKVIIGPHGSGFTNIVFCKPQTKIIDICAPEWINDCFMDISRLCKLNYHRIIGNRYKKHAKNEVKRANIDLNLEHFKNNLDKILD
jgi:capsular polysaccharide biosynthesis protein